MGFLSDCARGYCAVRSRGEKSPLLLNEIIGVENPEDAVMMKLG
jgi:hypothetical protein